MGKEMKKDSERRPIFVHASARSGSTYFFNVLRLMEPLLCFDEAISDAFSYYKGKNGQRRFARKTARAEWDRWSHDFLTRNSRAEFVDAWEAVMRFYPPFPRFCDYVPRGGILPSKLQLYLQALIDYASAKGKRAALCEIYSRGRAGALRDAFGGFHVTQYRDPLCQFGSCFRQLKDFGQCGFMVIPLQELGLGAENPLYSIIPEAWRVPALPWPADDRAQRWASTQQYISMILSSHPDTLQKVLRWHLLSWFLNNLAAIVHSDFVLDIDKAHDDLEYRESVREVFRSEIGVAPDFTEIAKYPSYYQFECIDIARMRDEIVSVINNAQRNGQLDAAIAALGRKPPTVSASVAVDRLCAKMNDALALMASTEKSVYISVDDWQGIVQRHRNIWANPQLRSAMRHIIPFALPVVQAMRMIGNMR
jgi:hypothetical protein